MPHVVRLLHVGACPLHVGVRPLHVGARPLHVGACPLHVGACPLHVGARWAGCPLGHLDVGEQGLGAAVAAVARPLRAAVDTAGRVR